MSRIICSTIFLLIFILSSLPGGVFGAVTKNVSVKSVLKNQIAREGKSESSRFPEVVRSRPIEDGVSIQLLPDSSDSLGARFFAAVEVATLGPNLIQNPSVETSGSGSLPATWFKGGYGTNNRVLTYPVSGLNSAKALQISISSYTTGDAKWFFEDVPVTPGKTYQFSDYYISNTQSILTLRYKMSDGSFTYPTLDILPPAESFTLAEGQFTVPPNVVSVTVFHLIKGIGQLTTDEFSLNEVLPSSDPNLITNSGFELTSGSGNPVGWQKGGWGTNARIFSYPVTGVSGSKAARVSISSYTTGDAKWFFDPIPVDRGIYTYSIDYQSNITSYLVARFEDQNGVFSYRDLAVIPPVSSFSNISFDFSIPFTARKLTIFHLIKSVGQLTIDNANLEFKAEPQGVFLTGGVSLTFDDAWLSQYQTAIPKLSALGLTGTFYVTSRQLADYGFPGYMSIAQIRDVFDQGHEIGAHTRTHAALSQLSAAGQRDEIEGSRNDLLALNIGPINSFAYPFGDYNATTLQIIREAGFLSARNSMGGQQVQPTSRKLELPRFPIEINTTLSQVKQQIDQAIANREWVILVFHKVDNGTDRYTVSPAVFNQIVEYIAENNVPTVTVSEGVSAMN